MKHTESPGWQMAYAVYATTYSAADVDSHLQTNIHRINGLVTDRQ